MTTQTTEALLDCRPEVLAFALLMEKELKANDRKGKTGWKGDHPLELASRVQVEAQELRDLVRDTERKNIGPKHPDADKRRWPSAPSLRERIASEAADVANMAMMVADVWGALPEALALQPPPAQGEPHHVTIVHDGFIGDVIGSYVTREGKRGIVVQQDGTRVVHVYREDRATLASAGEGKGKLTDERADALQERARDLCYHGRLSVAWPCSACFAKARAALNIAPTPAPDVVERLVVIEKDAAKVRDAYYIQEDVNTTFRDIVTTCRDARATIEAMREALTPFAKAADRFSGDDNVYLSDGIYVRDLRHARSLLPTTIQRMDGSGEE